MCLTKALARLTPRQTFLLLLAGMLGLIAAAFVLEYGFNVLPCKMCWWQRYGHMALAALALLGTLKPHKILWLPIAAAAGGTLAIALWQTAAQQGWLPFPPGCVGDPALAMSAATDLLASMQATRVIPCDKETFHLLGLTLANWNIPILLAVITLAYVGYSTQKAA